MPTINQLVRKGRTKIGKKSGDACTGQFAATAGGMRQGIYLHTEETEFRFAEGGQG